MLCQGHTPPTKLGSSFIQKPSFRKVRHFLILPSTQHPTTACSQLSLVKMLLKLFPQTIPVDVNKDGACLQQKVLDDLTPANLFNLNLYDPPSSTHSILWGFTGHPPDSETFQAPDHLWVFLLPVFPAEIFRHQIFSRCSSTISSRTSLVAQWIRICRRHRFKP